MLKSLQLNVAFMLGLLLAPGFVVVEGHQVLVGLLHALHRLQLLLVPSHEWDLVA